MAEERNHDIWKYYQNFQYNYEYYCKEITRFVEFNKFHQCMEAYLGWKTELNEHEVEILDVGRVMTQISVYWTQFGLFELL